MSPFDPITSTFDVNLTFYINVTLIINVKLMSNVKLIPCPLFELEGWGVTIFEKSKKGGWQNFGQKRWGLPEKRGVTHFG